MACETFASVIASKADENIILFQIYCGDSLRGKRMKKP
jgi:hypothetical protein